MADDEVMHGVRLQMTGPRIGSVWQIVEQQRDTRKTAQAQLQDVLRFDIRDLDRLLQQFAGLEELTIREEGQKIRKELLPRKWRNAGTR